MESMGHEAKGLLPEAHHFRAAPRSKQLFPWSFSVVTIL